MAPRGGDVGKGRGSPGSRCTSGRMGGTGAFRSRQTRNLPSAEAIVAQAVRFNELAPNMIVKIPATHAGMEAVEEATARGISINATVSFTLPQACAVAEAVERGLKRGRRTRRTSAAWDRCARSWWAALTTG